MVAGRNGRLKDGEPVRKVRQIGMALAASGNDRMPET